MILVNMTDIDSWDTMRKPGCNAGIHVLVKQPPYSWSVPKVGHLYGQLSLSIQRCKNGYPR